MPTVLITGTSTGFGHVTTELLAARGWRVFATMRDVARKDSLERALGDAGLSERVTFVQLDVTGPASIEAAVATVLSETDNTLDAVVHNAGIAVAGVLEDLPDADIRRVMETNFFGVLNLTRALLPIFREQRRGRIVLLSSQSAFAGQPGNSMYCASKWALEGWAESLAYEVGPFGIDVVLIEPGPYRTEIWNSTQWVVPSNSTYLSWLKLLRQGADRHQAKTSRDPKEVALVVAKALEAKRPRFRYQVGFFARQDADAAHPQRHHAISRPSARPLGLQQCRRSDRTGFGGLFTSARAERPLPR